MLTGGSRRPSCRWWGRTVKKGLLFASFMMILVCFTFLDIQMSYYEDDTKFEGNSFAFLSQRIWTPVKSDNELRKGRPGTATRKLSSHTERIFLYDLYRESFDEYDQSDNSNVADNIESVAPTATSGSFQRWNLTVGRRLPHVLIIGVKKGGTRALLEILRLHPDVRAPGPEPHFFDRYYYKGLQWYRKQMPISIVGQLTMEKTPSYLITPEVPARVANMSRDVRLLVVVRDPVTRAVSDYTQASSKRRDTRTFEDMAFLNASTGLVDTNWCAIKIGVYAKHLERWLRHFPADHFHFVSGERLITDPVAELAEVQDFLGLRRVISEKHFFFNQTKGFPCLRRTEESTVPHCLGKTKGRSHPYIPPSALQRLRDFYRPFNQKFYKMVGRNFGWL